MEVNDIISAALVGAVVGVLGRLVLPGRQRIGVFVTLLIGVGAAILGTYLAKRFGVDTKAPVSFWKLNWDWIVLAIQVGCALWCSRRSPHWWPTPARRRTKSRRSGRGPAPSRPENVGRAPSTTPRVKKVPFLTRVRWRGGRPAPSWGA